MLKFILEEKIKIVVSTRRKVAKALATAAIKATMRLVSSRLFGLESAASGENRCWCSESGVGNRFTPALVPVAHSRLRAILTSASLFSSIGRTVAALTRWDNKGCKKNSLFSKQHHWWEGLAGPLKFQDRPRPRIIRP